MTIPDDVMKAAQEVAKSCVERPYNKGTVAKAAGRIASAIMAERERCAKVAENYRTADEPFPGHAIAAAILRGDA